MATPLTHGLVGVWIAQLAPSSVPRWKLAIGCGVLAVVPDVDLVAFGLGVRYSHMMGHRGLSHSLVFALVVAAISTAYVARKVRPGAIQALSLCCLISLAVLSHPLLDAATNGGLGVGLFLPFSHERYFLPFRPIDVSPITPATFIDHAGRVLWSEARWVLFPLALGSGIVQLGRLTLGAFSRQMVKGLNVEG